MIISFEPFSNPNSSMVIDSGRKTGQRMVERVEEKGEEAGDSESLLF
jgi:hypothetical protein